jgi:hypothetical protein
MLLGQRDFVLGRRIQRMIHVEKNIGRGADVNDGLEKAQDSGECAAALDGARTPSNQPPAIGQKSILSGWLSIPGFNPPCHPRVHGPNCTMYRTYFNRV